MEHKTCLFAHDDRMGGEGGGYQPYRREPYLLCSYYVGFHMGGRNCSIASPCPNRSHHLHMREGGCDSNV